MSKNVKTASNREFREPGLLETLKEGFLGKRRTLDCVQVEITTRCPGRCSYCPRTVLGESWQSRDMEMETFERLWPLMRVSSRVHLQGWGEPLLNPKFFDMAALARRAGCLVSSTTCGLVMNDSLALKIVESGVDIVAFSLTGTDEVGNNTFRRGVDFKQGLRWNYSAAGSAPVPARRAFGNSFRLSADGFSIGCGQTPT